MASKELMRKHKEKKTAQQERRGFLKKAAWAAPTLVVLGELAKPTKVKAGFSGPPSDPGDGNGGWN